MGRLGPRHPLRADFVDVGGDFHEMGRYRQALVAHSGEHSQKQTKTSDEVPSLVFSSKIPVTQ